MSKWNANYIWSGREPWSSGYGIRLIFMRSWVQIPAWYTGWTRHFFTLICCKKCILCLKRPKINENEAGLAHLKKYLHFITLSPSCDQFMGKGNNHASFQLGSSITSSSSFVLKRVSRDTQKTFLVKSKSSTDERTNERPSPPPTTLSLPSTVTCVAHRDLASQWDQIGLFEWSW